MPNECDTTTPELDINPVVSELCVEEEACFELCGQEEACSELGGEEEPCSKNVMGSDEEDGCDGDRSFAVDEPLAEETVADVGNSTVKNPIPEEPSAEHGAASPVAHSSKEPSAEENVADVGHTTGKKHKRPSAEHGAASPVAHSSKGKAPQKRRPWQAAERPRTESLLCKNRQNPPRNFERKLPRVPPDSNTTLCFYTSDQRATEF
ncbi:hypothetical protein PAMA_016957 [Pampus argenteus]